MVYVELEWNLNPADESIWYYEIQRRTIGPRAGMNGFNRAMQRNVMGGWYPIAKTPASETKFKDNGRKLTTRFFRPTYWNNTEIFPDQSYEYRIRAVNTSKKKGPWVHQVVPAIGGPIPPQNNVPNIILVANQTGRATLPENSLNVIIEGERLDHVIGGGIFDSTNNQSLVTFHQLNYRPLGRNQSGHDFGIVDIRLGARVNLYLRLDNSSGQGNHFPLEISGGRVDNPRIDRLDNMDSGSTNCILNHLNNVDVLGCNINSVVAGFVVQPNSNHFSSLQYLRINGPNSCTITFDSSLRDNEVYTLYLRNGAGLLSNAFEFRYNHSSPPPANAPNITSVAGQPLPGPASIFESSLNVALIGTNLDHIIGGGIFDSVTNTIVVDYPLLKYRYLGQHSSGNDTGIIDVRLHSRNNLYLRLDNSSGQGNHFPIVISGGRVDNPHIDSLDTMRSGSTNCILDHLDNVAVVGRNLDLVTSGFILHNNAFVGFLNSLNFPDNIHGSITFNSLNDGDVYVLYLMTGGCVSNAFEFRYQKVRSKITIGHNNMVDLNGQLNHRLVIKIEGHSITNFPRLNSGELFSSSNLSVILSRFIRRDVHHISGDVFYIDLDVSSAGIIANHDYVLELFYGGRISLGRQTFRFIYSNNQEIAAYTINLRAALTLRHPNWSNTIVIGDIPTNNPLGGNFGYILDSSGNYSALISNHNIINRHYITIPRRSYSTVNIPKTLAPGSYHITLIDDHSNQSKPIQFDVVR